MSDASERLADVVRSQDVEAPHLIEELADGALITDIVCLVKYVDNDGRVGLSMAWTRGQDWVARRGMIESIRDMERIDSSDAT